MFRQRWILLAGLLATVAAAGLWTILTPAQYESTASVLLRTTFSQSVFPSVGASETQRFLRQPTAELEYANSTAFAAIANDGLPATVTVSPRYDNEAQNRSSQLEFVARSTNAVDAQTGANQWAMAYLTQRAEGVAGDIDATIAGIEAQVEDLEIQKREILEPLAPIEQALLTETDSDTISRLTTQRLSLRESLSDDLLPVELQLRSLVTDLSKLRIAAGFAVNPEISAQMSIEAPIGRQVAPNAARNMLLAAVLGSVIGVGLAVTSETLRSVVNSAADLQSIAPSIDVLAELPAFPKNTGNPLELANQVGSPYAESLERIVNVLLYRRVQSSTKQLRVVVTSPLPSEGKTTVATHVAMRLGFTHAETLLIDADLRRPTVHEALQLDRGRSLGLNRLLHEGRPLAPELIRLPGSTVRVLAAGRATNDAAALLRESFAPAIDALPNDYEIMLIDAPPVLVVTDAEVLAESADGIILVVRAGTTSKAKLIETLKRLSSAAAPVLGFVLVAADARSFGRTYGYNYHAPDAPLAPTSAPALPEPVAATSRSNGAQDDPRVPPTMPALVPGWSETDSSTADSTNEIRGIRVRHPDRDALIVGDSGSALTALAAAIASAVPSAHVDSGAMLIDETGSMAWCDAGADERQAFAPDLIVKMLHTSTASTPQEIHASAMTAVLMRSVEGVPSPRSSPLMQVGSLAAKAACFEQSWSPDVSEIADEFRDLLDQPLAKPLSVHRVPQRSRGTELGHADRVEAVKIGDRIVLYSRDRRTASRLNKAASRWWARIDGETPAEDVYPSMTRQEVAALVDRLVDKGFLELSDAGSTFTNG